MLILFICCLFLHCALSLAAQCIVIGPVCGSVATITRNFVHQTGSVGEGSDRLQLIKFWPSRAPGRGSGRCENFWLRLTTASAVFAFPLSAFFILTCADFNCCWILIIFFYTLPLTDCPRSAIFQCF